MAWLAGIVLSLLQYAPFATHAAVGSATQSLCHDKGGPKGIQARTLCQHGLSLYQRGRYRAAIEALQEAEKLVPGHKTVRYYLARSYKRMGKQFGAKGQFARQRECYKRALHWDPRLLEEASFVSEYSKLQARASQSIEHKSQPSGKPAKRPYKERNIGFGLGLTLGVEGLLGIQAGVLLWGIVNPLLTFSPVLQSLNVSLRVIPLRHFEWSPYISFGTTFALPLRRMFPAISPQGPIIHGTIGVHYVAPFGLTFVTGLSLTYDFTPQLDAPFLPIPTVQLSWYF